MYPHKYLWIYVHMDMRSHGCVAVGEQGCFCYSDICIMEKKENDCF